MRSNRDNSVGVKLMFSTTERVGSYLESIGLAEARMQVRALRLQMMPALATLTVCCSIVSWRIARAPGGGGREGKGSGEW